jgi:hypothetical protein
MMYCARSHATIYTRVTIIASPEVQTCRVEFALE